MKRFSVMVQEYGSSREVELCQMDHNPEATVAGLQSKTLMVHADPNARRRTKIPKYTAVRIVDHQAEA